MQNFKVFFFILIGLGVVIALTTLDFSPKTDEAIIKSAFKALKDGDWETYQSLTVTSAEFILKYNKVSPFKRKMTYAGGVLMPEEKSRQKKEFEHALKGGTDSINFKQAIFVKARLVHQDNRELLEGGSIPIKIYLVEVEQNGKKQTDLQPAFVVTMWGEKPRLLQLEFKSMDHDR